jgi:hypothetical protein
MIRKSIVALSLFVLLSASLRLESSLPAAHASYEHSVGSIDENSEYANGTIPTSIGSIWYSWINTSGTQVIYYSLFSDVVNSPIINFVGQHFEIGNTDVFIGNTLTLIEVYNDTDKDGIPQANFTTGISEISYYLLVNSSIGYSFTPIEKLLEGKTPHYKWGFRYQTIDGFLLYPEQQLGHAAAKVLIDHLGFNYDFYIVQNVSYLKTGFDIGQITEIQPFPGEPPISLNGLSLSLLFGTVTRSAKAYAAYVNGQPYNSTTATNPAISLNSSEIAVGASKAYEFVFGGNYNLTRAGVTETHEAKSEAAATTSVPTSAESRLSWILGYFENNLNMSTLFPSAIGIEGKVNLDYNVSTLLYRICYPVWDGLAIEHDPKYLAYLFTGLTVSEFPTLIVLPLLSALTLLAAMLHKKMKKPRAHPK